MYKGHMRSAKLEQYYKSVRFVDSLFFTKFIFTAFFLIVASLGRGRLREKQHA